jgi:hypothetical protein
MEELIRSIMSYTRIIYKIDPEVDKARARSRREMEYRTIDTKGP